MIGFGFAYTVDVCSVCDCSIVNLDTRSDLFRLRTWLSKCGAEISEFIAVDRRVPILVLP